MSAIPRLQLKPGWLARTIHDARVWCEANRDYVNAIRASWGWQPMTPPSNNPKGEG